MATPLTFRQRLDLGWQVPERQTAVVVVSLIGLLGAAALVVFVKSLKLEARTGFAAAVLVGTAGIDLAILARLVQPRRGALPRWHQGSRPPAQCKAPIAQGNMPPSGCLPAPIRATPAPPLVVPQPLPPVAPLPAALSEMGNYLLIHAVAPSQALVRSNQGHIVQNQAAGDMIGLLTEFRSHADSMRIFGAIGSPQALPLEPTTKATIQAMKGVNNRHMVRFQQGDWTDDTDQFLLIIRSLYRKEILNDPRGMDLIFAEELYGWMVKGSDQGGLKEEVVSGFKIFGKEKPFMMGLGTLVGAVLRHPRFRQIPDVAAVEIWKHFPPIAMRPAANGALMRTVGVAAAYPHDMGKMIAVTRALCRVTHVDPRCAASCVAVNVAATLMLRGARNFEEISRLACRAAEAVLEEEMQAMTPHLSDADRPQAAQILENFRRDLRYHLFATDWQTLDLDEGYKDGDKADRIGYTYKCMGAAFVGFRRALEHANQQNPNPFRAVMEELVREGGDTDTNGCVMGALLGAGGFSAPASWSFSGNNNAILAQAHEMIRTIAEKPTT